MSPLARPGRGIEITRSDVLASKVEAGNPLSSDNRLLLLDGLDVHLVMDNHATHRTEKVRKWLARRRHWHVHFTPTSASWLNQVERWFAEPAGKKLQRSAHRSVAELEADIMSFIDAHNEKPKPCR